MAYDGPIDGTWNRLLDQAPVLRATVADEEQARLMVEQVYARSDWPVTLAVCAVFRNEAHHLVEWIDFHIDEGVERFYLYDNGSTDGWEELLVRYGSQVEVTSWPVTGSPLRETQIHVYTDCLAKHRLDTRWLAVLDLDEFLFSPGGGTLRDVLTLFPRVAAVAANWRVYGTSGHSVAPPGGVLANFTRRAPDSVAINAHVKSVVIPALVVGISNAHHFVGVGPTVGENGDLVESPWRVPPTAELLRVNHYYTGSTSQFEAKVASRRAYASKAMLEQELDELNEVYDPILVGRGSG